MRLSKRIKNSLQDSIKQRGFQFISIDNFDFLTSLMYQLKKEKSVVTFIQIGANDGQRFDPIIEFARFNKNSLKGYVIEPVSDYFHDLEKTYKDFPEIHAVQCAIHNELEETIIYKVGKEHEDKVPPLALGVASFDPDHHKKTKIPSEYIVEERVKCTTLEKFKEERGIANVDVLVIDTEGYDYEILTAIDFKAFRPDIVHFEHGLKHQMMTSEQFDSLRQSFNDGGYQIFMQGPDATAYKTFLFAER